MDDTHYDGKDHSAVVSRDLGRQEHALDGLQYLPLGDVYAEEGMEEETYDRGGDAQDYDQGGNVAKFLLQSQSERDEQKAVAGVSHTEREEEQEEYREERSRVETIVGRAAVHIHQHLEHPYELVVLEFDGRVVLKDGFILEPYDIHLVQPLLYLGVVLRRSEAFEHCEKILGGIFGRC